MADEIEIIPHPPVYVSYALLMFIFCFFSRRMSNEIEIIPNPVGEFQPTIFNHIKYRVTSKDTPVLLWSAYHDEMKTKKIVFNDSTINIETMDAVLLAAMECNVCSHPFLPGENVFKVCVMGDVEEVRNHECQWFICGACIELDTQDSHLRRCPICRAGTRCLEGRYMVSKTKVDMIENINKLVSIIILFCTCI